MATDVEAQIAGNVWKIEKRVGDEVAEEEVLIIIESMKMEIPVEAPCAGRIAEIRVPRSDRVTRGRGGVGVHARHGRRREGPSAPAG
jgi:acetyl-CoA carboxylase biotin carboxyl carrier protein